MRIAVVVVCGLLLSGCADYYYHLLGEDAWPHEDNSLYTRLGGQPGVKRLVGNWLDNAAADRRISALFSHVDMAHLKATVSEQICVETGGPCVYTGRGLTDAHTGLVISNADFDAFLDNLHKAAAAQSIKPRDERHLDSILNSMRGQVVTVAR